MNTCTSTLIVIISMLLVAFTAQDAHAITRAEIIEEYKGELRQAYNDPSLNPAVTALCKSVARSFTIFLEDTNNLDYDLDEKQNKYYVDMTTQLELDANVRGDVTWRIFRDTCEAEVGSYEEPTRWNGWSHDIWSKVRTQQEQVEYEKELARLKAERKVNEAREKAEEERSKARMARKLAEEEKRRARCVADFKRRKAQFDARRKQCAKKGIGSEYNDCSKEAHERFLGKSARKRECYGFK